MKTSLDTLYREAREGWLYYFAGRTFYCMLCSSEMFMQRDEINVLVPTWQCQGCGAWYTCDPIQQSITFSAEKPRW